jgi:hypothetical protein
MLVEKKSKEAYGQVTYDYEEIETEWSFIHSAQFSIDFFQFLFHPQDSCSTLQQDNIKSTITFLVMKEKK